MNQPKSVLQHIYEGRPVSEAEKLAEQDRLAWIAWREQQIRNMKRWEKLAEYDPLIRAFLRVLNEHYCAPSFTEYYPDRVVFKAYSQEYELVFGRELQTLETILGEKSFAAVHANWFWYVRYARQGIEIRRYGRVLTDAQRQVKWPMFYLSNEF